MWHGARTLAGAFSLACLLSLASCVSAPARYSAREIELYDQAYGLYAQQKYQDALAILDRLLEANPKNEYAFRLRSMVEWVTDKPQSAITDLIAAQAINPRSAIISYNLGCVYESVGMPDKAVAAYTAAIKADPAFAHAWLNRANAYMRLGDRKAALSDYKKFVTLSSEQKDDIQALIDKLQDGP